MSRDNAIDAGGEINDHSPLTFLIRNPRPHGAAEEVKTAVGVGRVADVPPALEHAAGASEEVAATKAVPILDAGFDLQDGDVPATEFLGAVEHLVKSGHAGGAHRAVLIMEALVESVGAPQERAADVAVYGEPATDGMNCLEARGRSPSLKMVGRI